jgi:hypothetical protein
VRVVHAPGGVGEDPSDDRREPLAVAERTLATDVDVADTLLGRARGLMLRRVPEDYALVFRFDRPGRRWIHTAFVPVGIDVVWLVGDEVVRVETLRPWLGLAGATADTVVEFPSGGADGVEPGDTLRVEDPE